MISVSSGHIILTQTQPLGSGHPQWRSNPRLLARSHALYRLSYRLPLFNGSQTPKRLYQCIHAWLFPLSAPQGSRCEKCGKDHTREVAGADYPGSSCIACSCNGHGISDCTASQLLVNPDPVSCAASVTSCDPVYGNCTCKDNTGGDHCEVCLEGYYGDATTGTERKCPELIDVSSVS